MIFIYYFISKYNNNNINKNNSNIKDLGGNIFPRGKQIIYNIVSPNKKCKDNHDYHNHKYIKNELTRVD